MIPDLVSVSEEFFTFEELETIQKRAKDEGFSNISFIEAIDPEKKFKEYYKNYLRKKLFFDLHYLSRIRLRFKIKKLLENVQTIGVFTFPYYSKSSDKQMEGAKYKVSRFARGADYHYLLKKKLQTISSSIASARLVCDSTPLLERYYALKSGVGFIGRNTMLINEDSGSYFLLAFILFSKKLPESYNATATEYDQQFVKCGSCYRCVEACPGGALDGEGHLDVAKCYSYWSIENRKSEIPSIFKNKEWIYGCDLCQESCPYNSQPVETGEVDFMPSKAALDLADGRVENISRSVLIHSSFARAGKRGLQRNKSFCDFEL